MSATGEPVQASGGLVFRPVGDDYEVLVVHRPKYDDWSLPKGKDDPGERPEDAARREVAEETGQPARIVAPLAEVLYNLPSGREKQVRYYAMRPVGPATFTPDAEVDEVAWVSRREADGLLTYEHDRRLVADTDLDHLSRIGRWFLVRHAAAGHRGAWEGDDRLRPLSPKGERQAAALAERLASVGVDRVLSSPHLRCRQTVEPLAERLGIDVVDHDALAEGARWQDTLELVEGTSGLAVVACSHGDVIPDLLRGLGARGTELRSPDGTFQTKKASIWELMVEDGAVPLGLYHPPPEV